MTLEATKGGRAELSINDRSYALRTYPAADFPQLPGFPAGGTFEVSTETFASAVSRVLPCASKDTSRPVLSGVLLALSKGKATLAATDSYRMALFRDAFDRGAEGVIPNGDGSGEEAKAIVPARVLREAVRLGALGPENLTVALTENLAFFKAAGVTLSARLIAGQYPDYERLYHRIPRMLLRRRDRLEARTELTGAAIQEWLDHEHECLRYGLLPDLTREGFRKEIEASVVELSYHEHRFRVHARQWAEWGRRGGLATLARYGRGHFRLLALRRWGKLAPEGSAPAGTKALEERGAERRPTEAA